MSDPISRTSEWNTLAMLVEKLVDTDDPRLARLVLDLERDAGCALGSADRSAVMMGRRFARVHRLASAEPLPQRFALVEEQLSAAR